MGRQAKMNASKKSFGSTNIILSPKIFLEFEERFMYLVATKEKIRVNLVNQYKNACENFEDGCVMVTPDYQFSSISFMSFHDQFVTKKDKEKYLKIWNIKPKNSLPIMLSSVDWDLALSSGKIPKEYYYRLIVLNQPFPQSKDLLKTVNIEISK